MPSEDEQVEIDRLLEAARELHHEYGWTLQHIMEEIQLGGVQ
jgi:hypothetical protein